MDHLVGISGLRLIPNKPFFHQFPGFHGKVSKEEEHLELAWGLERKECTVYGGALSCKNNRSALF